MDKKQMLIDEIKKQISRSPYRVYINFSDEMLIENVHNSPLSQNDDKFSDSDFSIDCTLICKNCPFSPQMVASEIQNQFSIPNFIEKLEIYKSKVYFYLK